MFKAAVFVNSCCSPWRNNVGIESCSRQELLFRPLGMFEN